MDGPRRRAADRRHPGRGREQTRRPVARRRQRPEGVFFRWATSWQRNQWTHDEGATRIGATASCTNWPIAGSGLSLDLERDRMRFERVHPRSAASVLTGGDTIEITHACTRARDTHTQFTMTLLGRRAGTACWLTGVVMRRSAMDTGHRPPNCRKPALERLARHSLFDRYMKAQLRLAGGRRKPGRHGFSSDTPRGSLALPYICATCATCLSAGRGGGSVHACV